MGSTPTFRLTLALVATAWGCSDREPVALSATAAVSDGAILASDTDGATASEVDSFLEEGDSPLISDLAEQAFDDWDAILERRLLRVLVVPGRTSFFVAKGRGRGFELEMFVEFQKHVNRGLGDTTPFRVAFVPVAQDMLIPALLNGHGDVAAALQTITAERTEDVAFTQPYMTNVSEVIVSSSRATPLTGLEDLAGRSVYVPSESSYVESLQWLSGQLVALDLPPIDVASPGDALVSEDLLELVSAGVIDHTLVDRHLAVLWSELLTGLVVRDDLAVAEGGQLAWAVRPGNPGLLAELNAFVEKNAERTLIGNVLFKRYFTGTNWLRHPQDDLGDVMLGPLEEPIRRYAEQFGFDWRLVTAQAYQESGLDNGARSHVGAIGLMQLMPATAKDMGFEDVSDPDDNLHAGVKYMAWLRDHHFGDADVPEAERVRFALAAYNAGVGRVRRWRKEAVQRGLDPNRWHGSVDRIAQADVGPEPVRYVGMIEKYVVAFSLLLDIEAEESEQRDALRKRRGH